MAQRTGHEQIKEWTATILSSPPVLRQKDFGEKGKEGRKERKDENFERREGGRGCCCLAKGVLGTKRKDQKKSENEK